jgi:hypothetical protein
MSRPTELLVYYGTCAWLITERNFRHWLCQYDRTGIRPPMNLKWGFKVPRRAVLLPKNAYGARIREQRFAKLKLTSRTLYEQTTRGHLDPIPEITT